MWDEDEEVVLLVDAKAPIVVGALTLKVFTMYYGASRDSAAAVAAGAAFGQGGYKCNPVPK